jgi:hypothetical protein
MIYSSHQNDNNNALDRLIGAGQICARVRTRMADSRNHRSRPWQFSRWIQRLISLALTRFSKPGRYRPEKHYMRGRPSDAARRRTAETSGSSAL